MNQIEDTPDEEQLMKLLLAAGSKVYIWWLQFLPVGLAAKARRGYSCRNCAQVMPIEPRARRAAAFFDGQNLFRHAKDAFGHYHPNYDPAKLAAAVCEASGWNVGTVRFYTGIPDAKISPIWHGYWAKSLDRHASRRDYRDLTAAKRSDRTGPPSGRPGAQDTSAARKRH